VTRNGRVVTINSEELVVGDILKIEPGKTVPADCILFESVDMTT